MRCLPVRARAAYQPAAQDAALRRMDTGGCAGQGAARCDKDHQKARRAIFQLGKATNPLEAYLTTLERLNQQTPSSTFAVLGGQSQ